MGREPIRNRRSFQRWTKRPNVTWGISRRFHRLSPGPGHVAHALRTRLPVAARRIAAPAMPLDLHVLCLPLAFILSQDQTLLCIFTKIQSPNPGAFIPKKYNDSRVTAIQRNQRSRFSRYLLVLPFSLFNELSFLETCPRLAIPLGGTIPAPKGAGIRRQRYSKELSLSSSGMQR